MLPFPFLVLLPQDAPKRLDTSPDTSHRILAVVREHPGLPVGEIVRRVELGSGTVYYHLNRLARQKLIRRVAAGRRRLVFALDDDSEAREAKALSLVRGRTARVIAETILQRPTSSILDLVAATGESQRAVYYHVRQLKEAGLILTASAKRYRNVKAAPQLASILARSDGREDADPSPPH